VKFACDTCGKRFASVDEPAPGRTYRIRCRCGDVMIVRAPEAGRAAAPSVRTLAPRRASASRPAALPPRPGPRESPPHASPPPLPTSLGTTPMVDAVLVDSGPASIADAVLGDSGPTLTPAIVDDPFARAAAAEAAAPREETAASPDETPRTFERPLLANLSDETPVELSGSEELPPGAIAPSRARGARLAVAGAIVAAALVLAIALLAGLRGGA
jgi:hypothetical protein